MLVFLRWLAFSAGGPASGPEAPFVPRPTCFATRAPSRSGFEEGTPGGPKGGYHSMTLGAMYGELKQTGCAPA